MVAKATTRMSTNTQGKSYIYLPAGLVSDSAFPFSDSDVLKIEFSGKKLVIEKT